MTAAAVDITMPRLADQMEEGTIISWIAEDGQAVSVGEEIVEIETDKATMPYVAEVEGVLQIVAPVGATVAVGEVIARVAAGGDAQPKTTVAVSEPESSPVVAEPPPIADDRVQATPVARRTAAAHGIDLTALKGTGPRGRIKKDDVLEAAGIDPQPDSSPSPPAWAEESVVETATAQSTMLQPTRLQQVVARRMAQAKATIPHFQVQTDVVIDATLSLRASLKESAGDDPVPSLNDFIVRACAVSLREHALVNASYRDDLFEVHSRVSIGIAVSTDDGLVVATIPDADVKSLAQIARDGRRLAERVRAGTVTPPELAGATFTVSNLGMFGMTAISPVINPPQAAILGVGAARPTLARSEAGEVVDLQLLALTLSCDHRILNGADASRFLVAVKERLEAPLTLAL